MTKKYYCAFCGKPFESERKREFCTPKCRAGFHAADKQYEKRRRESLCERSAILPGSFVVRGGRQAIAFGNQDER